MKGTLLLIGKILGAVGTLAVAGTVLWQVFTYTDSVRDHNHKVSTTLDYLVTNDSLRREESDTIIQSLQRLNSSVTRLQEDFSALRSSYVHEQAEVLTPQEFLRLMEELGLTESIKKNKESNVASTVLDQ